MPPSARALLSRGPFAHRGLWSPAGPPENSLAAFAAAAKAGYGLELDVRLSADDEAVVFHDETLDRMTAESGPVRGRSVAELSRISLSGRDERVPTLEQALAVVAGRTPVLVELKTRFGEEGPLERRVARLLGAYDGPAAVLGFNPAALAAIAEADEAIPRGLNISDHVDADARVIPRRTDDLYDGVALARPHLLGLSKELLAGERPHALPIVAWTVRSPAEQAAVARACDAFMFEGYRA